jgi:hypothetical protein
MEPEMELLGIDKLAGAGRGTGAGWWKERRRTAGVRTQNDTRFERFDLRPQ